MENKDMVEGEIPELSVTCKGCALMLAMRCYEKHWWFHIVRDPLVWGMKFLAWVHGIRADRYLVTKRVCKGCLRFTKAELEQKSPTFNFLNRFIGPWFKDVRGGIISEEDKKEARKLAEEAMENGPIIKI